MPELPEVETIKNELLPHVVGRKITGVDLFWERIVREPSPEIFRARVTGQTINALSRRGKYLFFHLGGGGRLVMHMKMTGSLLVNPADRRFTRAILYLDDGTEVHFWDPRKFGVMWLASDESGVSNKLGPEPLDEDFTTGKLANILKGRAAPVKPVLLDQSLIAGIGNMYADEALFEARLHPLRPAGNLTPAEIRRLHGAIRKVLLKALARKGASVRNYIRPDGSPGTAHDEFSVAHGVGKNCPVCGGPIERIVVRGRGTYFCPRCQPAP
ncbi:MAG: DNA-formamidopyrimidine glycosylase [Chloroflexi bacterium RBG_16_56_11]|nr:MAG: DNA-formamidopyrimidine glycosylase [Chloroflexi bacterium RBG_16_56_11]